MTGTYAKDTTVTVEKSRNEIERILVRYGAEGFLYGWEGDRALIGFRINGRQIRFVLPLPSKAEDRFRTYKRGYSTYQYSEGESEKRWEQACRQRWRALKLAIQAKLEAVEAGIVTFEDEFLAHTILPDGRTFGQWAEPQIEQMYLTGKMPPLLLEGPKE